MRNIIIALLAIICLSSCNWRGTAAQAEAVAQQTAAALVVAEGTLAEIRDAKQIAEALGLDDATIDRLDGMLEQAQATVPVLREAAEQAAEAAAAAKESGSWWTAIIAVAATLVSGGAGVAVLGAGKAATAAKALHALRSVSAGIDAFRGAAPKPAVGAVEDALRETMTPEDKALIKELRAARQ